MGTFLKNEKMFRQSQRSSAGAPRASQEKSVMPADKALCVDNKEVNSSQLVEVEAHVAVSTNVILEDLTVTGDCDIIVSGQRVGELPRSKRKSFYYNPKTQQRTAIN